MQSRPPPLHSCPNGGSHRAYPHRGHQAPFRHRRRHHAHRNRPPQPRRLHRRPFGRRPSCRHRRRIRRQRRHLARRHHRPSPSGTACAISMSALLAAARAMTSRKLASSCDSLTAWTTACAHTTMHPK